MNRNNLGWSGLIVFMVLAFIFLYVMTVNAGSCNSFDGDLVSDVTVPSPNTDHCDHQGRVSLVCNTVVVEAYQSGQFSVQEHFTQSQRSFYLEAGQTYRFTPNPATEWLEVWSDDGFLGLVDIVAQECDDVVYPPDDRINWQGGDYFAVAYLVGEYLSIYNVETGQGVLVLQVNVTDFVDTCTEDGSVCVYLLEDDTVQLNIVDREGKLYEIQL